MKIIGLRIIFKTINKVLEEFCDELNNSEYSPTYIVDVYEFITKDNGKYKQISVWLEEGKCYSGYCGAEWLHTDIKDIETPGTLHYIPKTPLEVSQIMTESDGNDLYCMYEDDDGYYPSAILSINLENWKTTGRQKDKKQIYVFTGQSGIGKSYLAHRTDMKVFETDFNGLEGLNESYDIIVVGNKYKILFNALNNKLKNVDLVFVDFSNEYSDNLI